MQFRTIVISAALAAGLGAALNADGISSMPRQGEAGGAPQAASSTAKVKPAKKAKAKKVAAKPAKHKHWVCPMHDGGEGDHPGPCPKCGMTMVEEDQ
jgi:hypothetical protein